MTQRRINIIDATPVEAARSGPGNGVNGTPKRDPEAGWHVKNGSQERDTLILSDESALYADAAYSSKETRDKLEQLDIADQVQRKGYRNNPLSCADKIRNQVIAVTRSGGERPFATYKQHYGLAESDHAG